MISKSVDLARAGVIYAPPTFKLAGEQTLKEICNGCGNSRSKFDFIPDHIWGTDVSPACCVHDYMYHTGSDIEDKNEADRVFLNNMLRLIERDRHKWYKPTWLQRWRAVTYYNAVVTFGGPAFWLHKN